MQGMTRADGNFTWSGQIALFLLFVASALLLVRKFGAERWSPRLTVCASILGLHAAAGLLFFVSQARPGFTGWW